MCDAIFITKNGVLLERYPALDLVMDRAREIGSDLLCFRCFQVQEKKKKLKDKDLKGKGRSDD